MAKLIPAILSFIILSAHFFRAEIYWLSILVILCIVLLFLKKSWVPIIMQLILFLGTLEWLRTIYILINERLELGLPWLRLTIILGAVTILTLVSSLTFRAEALKARYNCK